MSASKNTKRGILIFCGLLLFGVVFCGLMPFVVLPHFGLGAGLPAITLPAEILVQNLFPGFNLTNGTTSMILVDLVILLIVGIVSMALRNQSPDTYVPNGITHVIDIFVEFWDNQARGIVGDKTPRVLPLALTVFVFVLSANVIKLFPGVETIGIISCAEPGMSGYTLIDPLAPVKILNVNGVDFKSRAGTKATKADTTACETMHPEFRPPGASEETEQTDIEGGNPNLFTIIPFFRPLATDMNMPLALAIIVFIAVEFWGIKELGIPYFNKFINIRALGNLKERPIMGGLDFVIGLVELFTEFMRLISLTLRLLGSMFAGGTLIAVAAYIVTFGVPLLPFGIEIAMGLIQAYVFALLTIIYAGQAMTHHGV